MIYLLQHLIATEEVIALDPNYAEAYASKAEIEFYYKNFEEMLKAGNKAIELAPNDAKVLGVVSIFVCFVRVGDVIPLKSLKKSMKLIVKLVIGLREAMNSRSSR